MSSGESIRRSNLSHVVMLLHEQGPLSRSQLAQKTGLNRSTIASLVAELGAHKVVVEAEPNVNLSVGRPSTVAMPNPECLALAVTPERDALTVGIVAMNGQVLIRHRHEWENPQPASETVSIMCDLLDGLGSYLSEDAQVLGVGIVVPGLVNSRDHSVRFAPRLGWVNEPIARMLSTATGYCCYAGNDASLGACAEHRFGAGRGVSDLLYLHGGTGGGIGGGVIHNGSSLMGVAGYAGELGDVGPFGQNFAELAEPRWQLEHLALLISNAVNVLNPARVILGGFLASLMSARPGVLDRLVSSTALSASIENVEIVPAELGEDVQLIGGAELVFRRLIDDPMLLPHQHGDERASRPMDL